MKKIFSISIDEKDYNTIQDIVDKDYNVRSKSHFIEIAYKNLLKKYENKKDEERKK